jgi:hypothetical protein
MTSFKEFRASRVGTFEVPGSKHPVTQTRATDLESFQQMATERMTHAQRIREERTSANGYWNNHYFVPTNKKGGAIK